MGSGTLNIALLTIALVATLGAAVAAFGLCAGIGPVAVDIASSRARLVAGSVPGRVSHVSTRQKQRLRLLVLFTGGISILAFSLIGKANLDLDGFFLLLFEGVAGAAIGHTIAIVIIGPALLGRILCGWGYWRAMMLEVLPMGHGEGRRKGIWRYLPFTGVAGSLTVAVLGFSMGHHASGVPGSALRASTLSLLCGVGVYYAASIGLAFAVNDQRAFCKYLCPNAAILRLTSRMSLLKMAAAPQACNACGVCSRVCPMDINVRAFAQSGRRVGNGECILCQKCAQMCPSGALRTTFRFRG